MVQVTRRKTGTRVNERTRSGSAIFYLHAAVSLCGCGWLASSPGGDYRETRHRETNWIYLLVAVALSRSGRGFCIYIVCTSSQRDASTSSTSRERGRCDFTPTGDEFDTSPPISYTCPYFLQLSATPPFSPFRWTTRLCF